MIHPFARPHRTPAVRRAASPLLLRSLALAAVAAVPIGTATAQALEAELVRLDAHGPTVLPDALSNGAQISPDGQWTLFRSAATNLVALSGLTEPGPSNLFLRDARDGSFILVNQGPSGELLGLGNRPAMVSRGAVATAFVSTTDVPQLRDANGRQDIYVHDRLTGVLEWVSDAQPLGGKPLIPDMPSVSDDGNLVAWALFDGLGLSGKVVQLAVHDRAAGKTRFITRESGIFGEFVGRPLLSGDATKLFFSERLKVTPGYEQVLKVMDLSGAGTRVLTRFQVQAKSSGQQLAVSRDGTRIAFVGVDESSAVPANWNQSLFTYDLTTDTLTCIAGCAPAETFSYVGEPSLSADGRFVGYNASGPGHPAALLEPAQADGTYLVHDTEGGLTYDMLVNASAQLASNPSKPVTASNLSMRALSHTGRRVVFDSNATNLALPIEPVLGFGGSLRSFQRQLHDDGADLAFGRLVAATTSKLEITGATPDAVVLIGVSTAGQAPTATPFGLVQLTAPWTVTALFTDASGAAEAGLLMPPGSAGTALFAQGLDVPARKRTMPVTGTVQ